MMIERMPIHIRGGPWGVKDSPSNWSYGLSYTSSPHSGSSNPPYSIFNLGNLFFSLDDVT